MPSVNKSKDALGTYHIAQHPELYTPARSNVFVFMPIFTEDLLKDGVIKASATSSDYISKEQAQEVLRLSVDASAVPNPTQNVVEVKRGNTTIKFAGAWTFGEGSFKFNDYVGADTKSALYAWRRKSMDVTDETVGRAENYKVKAILIEYTPDFRQVRYWDFYGCWISAISENDFASDDDGKREITATIQYDRAIPHLPDDLEQIEFVPAPTE